MKYILFSLIGFFSFCILEVITANLTAILKSGNLDIDSIRISINLLTTVIIICTCILVDTIKTHKKH